mmetsp:Transcript_13025/g.19674  ORF Transcript_13025/g.19674 Transcript_13025/m.19674 type:complete len:450 (+) Transcript_13025:523-1872(+)
MAVLVFLGEEHGDTQSAAARNDAHLVHRIMLRHQTTHNSVARLVISRIPLFFLAHHHGLALGAHHDLVFGKLELFHGHETLVATGREERRLVDQVCEVRTGESGRATSDQNRLDAVRQGHFLHVHLEDLLTTNDVWQANNNLTVETARAQQCRVENVGTVGSGNYDNAFITLKTVHLNEQLVERLFTLVMTATHAGATVATNSIDLVDEDNAGALLLGLFEHVTNPGSTHAHEHFDKVRTGDGEEGHLGFAGNSLGEQGFTRTRLTNHQDTFGDAAAKTLEFAGIPQEIHQFLNIFLGFINTGHVREGGLDLVFAHQTRFTLAERHGAFAATAALHLAHEEHKQCDDDQYRKRGYQKLCPQALALRLLTDNLNVVREQIVHQLVVRHLRTDCLELGAVTTGTLNLQPIDCDLTDLAFLDHLHKLGIVDLLAGGGGRKVLKHHQQHGGYN